MLSMRCCLFVFFVTLFFFLYTVACCCCCNIKCETQVSTFWFIARHKLQNDCNLRTAFYRYDELPFSIQTARHRFLLFCGFSHITSVLLVIRARRLYVKKHDRVKKHVDRQVKWCELIHTHICCASGFLEALRPPLLPSMQLFVVGIFSIVTLDWIFAHFLDALLLCVVCAR